MFFKVMAVLFTDHFFFLQTDICDYFSYQGHHFLRIYIFWDMESRQWVNFLEVLWQRSTETSGTYGRASISEKNGILIYTDANTSKLPNIFLFC